MKAPPRRRAGKPGGGKSQEGIGSERRLTTDERTTDPHPEQSLEGGVTGRGAGGQLSVASWHQPTRRHGPPTRWSNGCGEQTPEERTLDVVVG